MKTNNEKLWSPFELACFFHAAMAPLVHALDDAHKALMVDPVSVPSRRLGTLPTVGGNYAKRKEQNV